MDATDRLNTLLQLKANTLEQLPLGEARARLSTWLTVRDVVAAASAICLHPELLRVPSLLLKGLPGALEIDSLAAAAATAGTSASALQLLGAAVVLHKRATLKWHDLATQDILHQTVRLPQRCG